MVEVLIHRGAEQIGGACVEIRASGESLLLDLGAPLDLPPDADPVAAAPGGLLEALESGSCKPLALLISHAHQDHYGLASLMPKGVPIFCGVNTSRLITAMALANGASDLPTSPSLFSVFQPFTVGGFRITPHLVDHSAFDAYGFLIEVEGKSIYYTGDFRAHGRKSALFDRLKDTLHRVDCMLMEGTLVGGRSEAVVSEDALEREFEACISRTPGLVLVTTGSMNIDRIVTVFRAAKKCGRILLVDLFTALVLDSIEGHPRVPRVTWPRIRVAFHPRLADKFKAAGLEETLGKFRDNGIRWTRIAERPEKFVLLLKPGYRNLLGRFLPDLDGSTWIYSLWRGYLDRPGSPLANLRQFMAERGARFVHLHTSGHARLSDLQAFAKATRPKALVPIHTAWPDEYAENFEGVVRVRDGEPYRMAS